MRAFCLSTFALVVCVQLSPGAEAGLAEDHRQLIARFNDAVRSFDLAALDDVVAVDVVRHCQATPELDIRSLEQLKAFLKANRQIFPDEKTVLSQLVVEGDRVAFWGSYSGTQEGQMGPFPPSGKRMQIDVAGIFRIADGKIAEYWITWDNATALAQLGHLPPPPVVPE